MAITITFPGFNYLGGSVNPIILSMGHFLYRYSTLCKKIKKIYRVEVFCAPWNSVHLTLSFSYAAFSSASVRVKVCENDDNISDY